MREVPWHLKSIIIGDFSINLAANGDVEFRTFDETAKTTLTRDQALDLLQWLSEQKERATMPEVHPDYGPAATYSEHRQGELVSYWQQNEWDSDRKIYSGEILWVCAPTAERGVMYIVAPSTPTGWVDMVYPSDVVIQS